MNDCAVCIKYAKSSRAHRVHTCICLGVKQHVLKSTCKASKDETRSYCLSALATLWRIACTVLCCAVHDQSVEFFGGRSEEKVLVWRCRPPVLTGEGTGQQCSMGNAKFPQTVECFSSLSHNRGAKRFQWKIISLMCVCLGPSDLEEIK